MNGNLAPLAKDDLVGFLRIASAAHRTEGILHRARLDERIDQLRQLVTRPARRELRSSARADRAAHGPKGTLQVRRGQAPLPKVLLPPPPAAPSLLVLLRLFHPFYLFLAIRSLVCSCRFRIRQGFGGERPRDPESSRERSLGLQQLANHLVIRREAEEVGGAIQLGELLLHRIRLLAFFPSRAGRVGGDLSGGLLISAVTLERRRHGAADALLVYNTDGAFWRATGTGFLLGFGGVVILPGGLGFLRHPGRWHCQHLNRVLREVLDVDWGIMLWTIRVPNQRHRRVILSLDTLLTLLRHTHQGRSTDTNRPRTLFDVHEHRTV